VPRSPIRAISRLTAVATATLTVGASLAFVGATHASAASADYQFLADVNNSRAQHGLNPLTMVSDLHSLATNWSQHMASGGCGGGQSICHNPNLQSEGGNWQEIGENVGVGPDESSIENAFMNSPEHRANILNPDYTQVGIGTATGSDGRLYVTQDFREPMGSSSTSSSSSSSSHHSSHHTSSSYHSSTTPQQWSGSTHRAAARAPRAAAPRPVPTLAARLRSVAHRPSAVDPVQQALAFSATMRAVAG
jgi:uncharacterized protein YkwD